jgi:hypothetical protein
VKYGKRKCFKHQPSIFLKATAGLAAASGIVALPNKVNAAAELEEGAAPLSRK